MVYCRRDAQYCVGMDRHPGQRSRRMSAAILASGGVGPVVVDVGSAMPERSFRC